VGLKQLKYGLIRGLDSVASVVAMAASQALAAASGRFVFMNDGAATLCDDDSTTICGFIEDYARTPDTGEKVKMLNGLDQVFRVPIINGTFVVGMIGDQCDLDISSSIQGVDLEASSHDLVIIVDGDTVDSEWVDVRMNPREMGTGLGTDA